MFHRLINVLKWPNSIILSFFASREWFILVVFQTFHALYILLIGRVLIMLIMLIICILLCFLLTFVFSNGLLIPFVTAVICRFTIWIICCGVW
ncbi:hypothetical protein BDV95DRAFT_580273 [Massariosphaeria phaeospora]|uniref:Uncharacterized protein n=1 Tax=Massariosphaeria phaeospora TaxID=100035 RepID=A0A7C8I189_9PLEO|nr:hypothetical protein BDV95DRAFT_580273 [Massariosphaeria phaeospora]